jgi:hypothetical protein
MRAILTLCTVTCGLGLLFFSLLDCSSSSSSSDAPDAGGTSGACVSTKDSGTAAIALSVDDTAFSPAQVTADDLSLVTVTLTNKGTKPHGFTVQCASTPNTKGCPTTTCFPDASTIDPIPPDASATATFTAPHAEGTYTFGSGASGDTMTGQFNVN